MPRCTSGRHQKPRSARITRKSCELASMAPAPKACPLIAQTVGSGKVSRRL
ncbi:Uncharacterised protein [Mycobacteroides abscessus subsp. abscessus]|nr:Uncharacterised protein [Mycobacteroides abscessus subsp. abscessus]